MRIRVKTRYQTTVNPVPAGQRLKGEGHEYDLPCVPRIGDWFVEPEHSLQEEEVAQGTGRVRAVWWVPDDPYDTTPIVEVLVVIPVDGIPDTYGVSDASGS